MNITGGFRKKGGDISEIGAQIEVGLAEYGKLLAQGKNAQGQTVSDAYDFERTIRDFLLQLAQAGKIERVAQGEKINNSEFSKFFTQAMNHLAHLRGVVTTEDVRSNINKVDPALLNMQTANGNTGRTIIMNIPFYGDCGALVSDAQAIANDPNTWS